MGLAGATYLRPDSAVRYATPTRSFDEDPELRDAPRFSWPENRP